VSSSTEPRLILGTAGHIDHGKTALVRALTGSDTDRLPEEKARGISIELGFAALDLPGVPRIGVIDVPGHERLVRSMVAGASGIDLVLLCVAADDGVMPQTREHLAICGLLGVERGVVALTKCDAVDAETLELARHEMRELLAGSALDGAADVPVSVRTGSGLAALRTCLAEVARSAQPRTPRSGPARLAIDRCFAVRGAGSVVTGSLIGAALTVGDALELLPGRERGRVRGLQSHGVPARRCEPGTRCAINLQGIERSALERGRVLAAPGALEPSAVFDVRLAWLETSPAAGPVVAVSLLLGTAERRARVAPIGSASFAPGWCGFARIHLTAEPLAALPGDRFVLRGFARTAHGGATLAGGEILDVAPPRRRRSDPGLLCDLERLARRDPRGDVVVRVTRSGMAGESRALLRRQTGLAPEMLEAVLAALVRDAEIAQTARGRSLATSSLAAIEARLLAALAGDHRDDPLCGRFAPAALCGSLPDNVRPDAAALALERLARRGAIVVDAEGVALARHRTALPAALREAVERVAARLAQAGLEPPSPRDLATQLGLEPRAIHALLAHLARAGRVLRAPGDLWFDATAVATLRERVRAHLSQRAQIATPDYKKLIGAPRRSAVPLMELFDAEGLTRRDGNLRRLRGPPHRVAATVQSERQL
jgi:selenocysteine-specific elongation factor